MPSTRPSTLPADWQDGTPGQLSRTYNFGQQKVLAWINSGELTARNLATTATGRPIYRIMRSDWERFLDSRASAPARSQSIAAHAQESSKSYV